jgi:hypothetical protein
VGACCVSCTQHVEQMRCSRHAAVLLLCVLAQGGVDVLGSVPSWHPRHARRGGSGGSKWERRAEVQPREAHLSPLKVCCSLRPEPALSVKCRASDCRLGSRAVAAQRAAPLRSDARVWREAPSAVPQVQMGEHTPERFTAAVVAPEGCIMRTAEVQGSSQALLSGDCGDAALKPVVEASTAAAAAPQVHMGPWVTRCQHGQSLWEQVLCTWVLDGGSPPPRVGEGARYVSYDEKRGSE